MLLYLQSGTWYQKNYFRSVFWVVKGYCGAKIGAIHKKLVVCWYRVILVIIQYPKEESMQPKAPLTLHAPSFG